MFEALMQGMVDEDWWCNPYIVCDWWVADRCRYTAARAAGSGHATKRRWFTVHASSLSPCAKVATCDNTALQNRRVNTRSFQQLKQIVYKQTKQSTLYRDIRYLQTDCVQCWLLLCCA